MIHSLTVVALAAISLAPLTSASFSLGSTIAGDWFTHGLDGIANLQNGTVWDGRLNSTASKVSSACAAAWNATIDCDARYFSPVESDSIYSDICQESCRTSLIDYGHGLAKNCTSADMATLENWATALWNSTKNDAHPYYYLAVSPILDQIVKGNTTEIVDFFYYDECAKDLNNGTLCITLESYTEADLRPLPAHMSSGQTAEYCNNTCVLQKAWSANKNIDFLHAYANDTDNEVNNPADTCANFNTTLQKFPQFQADAKANDQLSGVGRAAAGYRVSQMTLGLGALVVAGLIF